MTAEKNLQRVLRASFDFAQDRLQDVRFAPQQTKAFAGDPDALAETKAYLSG